MIDLSGLNAVNLNNSADNNVPLSQNLDLKHINEILIEKTQ